VNNVYGDLGQIFASTLVAQPRVCAAIMGILLRGLGPERVVWGSDALWTGSPQWQIEGLRRLEIPEDMQKKHGFKPLGGARGAVKTAIFGDNNARLYNINQKRASLDASLDRFAALKLDYEKAGPDPSNLRYGYINTAGTAAG
jgi:predicted TIM-barrel fold metal-dependent hydrolase